MEGERHQLLRQVGQALRDEALAGLVHDLEPEQETVGVEALVFAGLPALPQLFVPDLGQLLRRRQRDQLTGVFEPDVVDQLAQQGARQRLDLRWQLGCFEHAREQLS